MIIPGMDSIGGEDSKKTKIEHHIDEIKSMREEINWRVRTAYNSSIIFISAISVIGGTIFSNNNTFLDSVKKQPELLSITGIVVLIAISAWVGVQNANHLIEKRIELYSLELLKVVVAESDNVYCAWLGYLYGSNFFKNKVKNFLGKFLNASIGMFMYFLPNLITIILWSYILVETPLKNRYFLFWLATAFLLVSVGSTVLFFFYVIKVNKKYSAFYDDVMVPYFKRFKPELVPG